MLPNGIVGKGQDVAGLPDIDRVEITQARQLWAWLAAAHDREAGVLLVTWKAAHADRYVRREAVLDALVAHGWIDGRRWKLDADRTAQLITPRRTQAWSQSYKERAARLRAEGRMHPAGEARVREGQASGLWDVFADVDALIVPADLDAALGRLRGDWDGLAPSYRRNVLRWIKLAKADATRAKRVAAAAGAVARGEKLPQM